jgi:outer membrane murein-binding lipoprotein Lpp
MSEQISSDSEDLEKRVAELEKQVEEMGHAIYDLIQELRGNEQLAWLSEPTCPPFCPRG